MKLSVVLFLIAISTALAGSSTVKTLVFPAPSSNSYVELIPRTRLRLRAFTLCMRVATELTGYRSIILFSYRTSNRDELNVWRDYYGGLSLFLGENSGGAKFKVPDPKALETHLCVTWESSYGATNFYVDGRKSVTKIYKHGHTTLAGGRIILGQDTDSVVGKFDYYESFVGEISDVNMWSYVLSESAIQQMACGGRLKSGNVINWGSTRMTLHGNVDVLHHKL
ncbi:pentraxin fusion protein-like [Cheilinus undulatus]|uniref:pentraxin fusion protein-like n=1 Tax=Cheilinus undulatus TaxID=241271 RepID=UPI001BD41AFA|nr:pentraxin fusion protein-like [Cheilinus undulatus]